MLKVKLVKTGMSSLRNRFLNIKSNIQKSINKITGIDRGESYIIHAEHALDETRFPLWDGSFYVST